MERKEKSKTTQLPEQEFFILKIKKN